MAKVNEDLVFEFGSIQPNGKREFVISAAGIKSAFPSVEALHESAPILKRWVWVKYRPRRTDFIEMSVDFGGRKVRVDDVHYLLARDGDKVGVLLFFYQYTEKEKTTLGQIGLLMLDHALGEYAVEMQVGFIEFCPRDSQYFEKASPLGELPAHFDAYWGRKTH